MLQKRKKKQKSGKFIFPRVLEPNIPDYEVMNCN